MTECLREYRTRFRKASAEIMQVLFCLLRKKRFEHDKEIESKDGLKQRFEEILETINSRDSLLDEFDEQIFNALVEKIEVLKPTHFVFELKSGMKVVEIKRAR